MRRVGAVLFIKVTHPMCSSIIGFALASARGNLSGRRREGQLCQARSVHEGKDAAAQGKGRNEADPAR
jgi:hypothetical protein